MRDDSLIYTLWLLTSLGVANPKIHDIISMFKTAQNAFEAPDGDYLKIKSLSMQERETLKKYKNLERANKLLEICESKQINILTIDSSDYPSNLKNIENPPVALFYAGNRLVLNNRLCISIVGTRDMTKYGAAAAEHLAFELASAGVCIISGLAKGIDCCAHKGALNAAGNTAAVLGCGVDYVYPYENKQLYDDILDKGAVFSEFYPGTPPLAKNFQLRNRLLSGISEGVVVVESPKKGGSLITVKWALEQGRDVFAVPGQIISEQSEGTNELIKQGAKLVSGAYDILEEYVYKYAHKINLNRLSGKLFSVENDDDLTAANRNTEYKTANSDKVRTKVKTEKQIILNSKEQAVYDILSELPKELTQIVDESGISLNDAMLVLVSLQIAGHITELPGGFYVRS